ncbi:MAG: cupin domain-containing protein [Acutalibacteraceae bacterium]
MSDKIFPKGEPNTAFEKYFIGKSYLQMLSTDQLMIANVTFEPGCRNNWHIHHAVSGGGQILLCTGGTGWYQESGKNPRKLAPGDVVNIPANVKHWHGAAKGSKFTHIAIEVPGENCHTEWCEPVTEEEYEALKKEAFTWQK